MAVSTSTTQSREQAPPTAAPPMREPWRRQWGEPAVAGPIISSLVIALFGVGVVAFQSLKDDIRGLQDDIRGLQDDISAVETRLVGDMKDLRAELKADNRALGDKLDRVLENLRP